MSQPTGVLCAVRGPTERAVARVLGADRRLEVTRRCADLAELLAAAGAGLGQVAVVSGGIPGLDRTALEDLHQAGVWVVGLTDAVAGWSADRLRLLGVDVVVPEGDEEAVARAVLPAVHQLLADAALGERPGGRSEVVAEEAPPAAEALPLADDGRIIAVWGPTGAPGRTTIALNLAAELAEVGRRHGGLPTLLVDADTYGGTVAQMVGLLDEAPGIAAAARAAGTGRLDVAQLAALTPVLDGGLRVLSGISRPDRWFELSSANLEAVYRTARRLARWTVVDCAFSLEADEALSYDTRAPRRNGATLGTLAEADLIVVVGAGDPVGLQRLVRGLADLDDRGLGNRLVVVNRLRASASGPSPRDAVQEALRRYASVADVWFIPEDQRACDGAVLTARTLLEHAPTSPIRRAVAALAGEVVSLSGAGRAD